MIKKNKFSKNFQAPDLPRNVRNFCGSRDFTRAEEEEEEAQNGSRLVKMEGKTAPTANSYVISISLAGRISRGSREKVFYRQKKLDRLSVVPRGGEILTEEYHRRIPPS